MRFDLNYNIAFKHDFDFTRSQTAYMYEHKTSEPLTQSNFAFRLLSHFMLSFAMIMGSLAIGIAGYSYFESLPLADAFLNTAMLLGGMGPVNAPQTLGGKIFAGVFALYAGLIFIVSGAVLITPVVHRVLHVFHWHPER